MAWHDTGNVTRSIHLEVAGASGLLNWLQAATVKDVMTFIWFSVFLLV